MEHHPVNVLITVPFPEPLIEQLREVSPRLQITIHSARKAEDIPDESWERVEVLYTDIVLPAPERVPNLRWLQFHYAGIDFALESPLMQKPDLMVTTLSGAAAPQASEFLLTMMLALSHRLPELIARQSRAEWPRERGDKLNPRELRNSTVGIIGYGSLGRELARLLQPFNVTILATKREVMHPQDTGYIPEGLGDPGGDLFTRLYPVEALCSLLKECDFVVVTLPLTPLTTDLIGEKEFRAMKTTAYLIDIGRGGVINSKALLSALQENRIAGAALDVFTTEPLPSNSPFWKLPNVVITPHIAGASQYYRERAIPLFAENLRRYLNNSPLLNRYEPQRKY